MAVDRLHATLLENDLEILKLDIYLGCGFLHFIWLFKTWLVMGFYLKQNK